MQPLFSLLLLTLCSHTVFSFPSCASPRESEDSLDGIMHLGRCADKAEMAAENRLPMDLVYPCPKDQNLLNLLQMDSTEFSNIVSTSQSDSELTQRLKEKNPSGYSAARLQSSTRFASIKHSLKANSEQKRSVDGTSLYKNDGC
jgi:hypothetical protein